MPPAGRRGARRSASSSAGAARRVSGRARRDSSSLRRGPRDRAVSLERPMNPLLALAPPIAAALVRLLGATLRLRAEGVEMLAPSWTAARPLIYCVWHGRILMVPWLNARLRRSDGARAVSVLASRSRDGGLIADYAGRFGLEVVRGSSSRGGAGALRALGTAVPAGRPGATAHARRAAQRAGAARTGGAACGRADRLGSRGVRG